MRFLDGYRVDNAPRTTYYAIQVPLSFDMEGAHHYNFEVMGSTRTDKKNDKMVK